MKKETVDEIVGRALRGEPYVPTGGGDDTPAQPAAPVAQADLWHPGQQWQCRMRGTDEWADLPKSEKPMWLTHIEYRRHPECRHGAPAQPAAPQGVAYAELPEPFDVCALRSARDHNGAHPLAPGGTANKKEVK